MRLIDADELVEKLCKEYRMKGSKQVKDNYMNYIYDAQTVDAKLVIHARWQMPIASFGGPFCTNCKVDAKEFTGYDGVFYFYKPPYCPNCGAKMDLQEEKES